LIDYATSESWAEGAVKEDIEPNTEIGQDEEGNTEQQDYAININTGKFHLPGCASAQKVNLENIKYWTCTRDELTEDGYSPCGACRP
jgi:DNA-entry nuclease